MQWRSLGIHEKSSRVDCTTSLTWLYFYFSYVSDLHVSVHVCMCNWVFLRCLSFFACLPVKWKNGKLKWTPYLTHSVIVACFWQWCFQASCRDCMCAHQLCDLPSGFWSDASWRIFISETNLIRFVVCCFVYILTSFCIHPPITLPSVPHWLVLSSGLMDFT